MVLNCFSYFFFNLFFFFIKSSTNCQTIRSYRAALFLVLSVIIHFRLIFCDIKHKRKLASRKSLIFSGKHARIAVFSIHILFIPVTNENMTLNVFFVQILYRVTSGALTNSLKFCFYCSAARSFQLKQDTVILR